MSGLVPLTLATGDDLHADLLLVGCLQAEVPAVAPLPPELATTVSHLAGRAGWRGRENQVAETSMAAETPVAVVALRGLGKRAELDSPTLRTWLASAFEAARSGGYRRVAFALPAHPETTGEAAAERIERLLMVSGYRYDRYLGRNEDREQRIEEVLLVPPPGEGAAYERALPRARAAARAVERTRNLANTPPNVASPAWMEEEARKLADDTGMELTVLHAEELAARGMGGILAVGKGSGVPPRLLRLTWGSEGPVIALVGKGVTFDTGGISIKPATAMDEMKYDKSGACTVLALGATVAEMGLPIRLRVYAPLAENMPDGCSYRPGDIITCYNGKTVEIINTDAEGRMLLADALALAVEEGADVLFEYSTLTGASVIALGRAAAAVYSPNDELAGELLAAAERTGERLWRMPLWQEFVDHMKGVHADLKNSGDRWGSANAAAAFLSQFVGEHKRWAHFDIAGPANANKDNTGGAGSTGYGVALTLDWLSRLVGP